MTAFWNLKFVVTAAINDRSASNSAQGGSADFAAGPFAAKGGSSEG
jgi:hypothetical protein